jgi:hypothetical protein
MCVCTYIYISGPVVNRRPKYIGPLIGRFFLSFFPPVLSFVDYFPADRTNYQQREERKIRRESPGYNITDVSSIESQCNTEKEVAGDRKPVVGDRGQCVGDPIVGIFDTICDG